MKNTKQISSTISRLENEREKLEKIKASASADLEKKQRSYDSKNEKWQESDKGQEAYDAISKLEGEISYLDSAISNLDSCLDDLGGIEMEEE